MRTALLITVTLSLTDCDQKQNLGSNRDLGAADSAGDARRMATPGQKRIFVTKAAYSGGSFHGLSGADALCNASSQVAGLGGTWTAWLSAFGEGGPTVSAISRIQGVGPWYLIDGTLAFHSKANFESTPLAAINLDEFGEPIISSVWTGTDTGGLSSGFSKDCYSWTNSDSSADSVIGSTATAATWTQSETVTCDAVNRIYCVEQ